jgi:hypothetical protein
MSKEFYVILFASMFLTLACITIVVFCFNVLPNPMRYNVDIYI